MMIFSSDIQIVGKAEAIGAMTLGMGKNNAASAVGTFHGTRHFLAEAVYGTHRLSPTQTRMACIGLLSSGDRDLVPLQPPGVRYPNMILLLALCPYVQVNHLVRMYLQSMRNRLGESKRERYQIAEEFWTRFLLPEEDQIRTLPVASYKWRPLNSLVRLDNAFRFADDTVSAPYTAGISPIAVSSNLALFSDQPTQSISSELDMKASQ
jgi:hypothetical protein